MFAQGSELKVIKDRRIKGDFELKRHFLEVSEMQSIKTGKDTILRFKQETPLDLKMHLVQVVWNPALYSYGEISGTSCLFPGDVLELAIRPFVTKEPLPELEYYARLFVYKTPIG